MGSMSNLIRIMIVEDHAVVRQGLAALLATAPDFAIVAEAADGHQAIGTLFDVPVNEAAQGLEVNFPTISEGRNHGHRDAGKLFAACGLLPACRRCRRHRRSSVAVILLADLLRSLS